MQEIELFQQPFYKTATADVIKLEKEVNRRINARHLPIDISTYRQEEQQRIYMAFSEGYKTYQANLEDSAQAIKKIATEKANSYTNPQAESLRRQDFNDMLDVMSVDDFVEYVTNLMNPDEITGNWQLLAIKKTHKRLESDLKYRNDHYEVLRTLNSIAPVGPWKNSSDWQLNQKKQGQLLNIKTNYIWIKGQTQLGSVNYGKYVSSADSTVFEEEKGYRPISWDSIQRDLENTIREYATDMEMMYKTR